MFTKLVRVPRLTSTDNTLRGYGEIGYNNLNLINGAAGIVQADFNGQPLQLNGGGTFTNNGLIRALNGGTLFFNGSADVSNTGTVRSENGSNVQIQNRIIGGIALRNAGRFPVPGPPRNERRARSTEGDER